MISVVGGVIGFLVGVMLFSGVLLVGSVWLWQNLWCLFVGVYEVVFVWVFIVMLMELFVLMGLVLVVLGELLVFSFDGIGELVGVMILLVVWNDKLLLVELLVFD